MESEQRLAYALHDHHGYVRMTVSAERAWALAVSDLQIAMLGYTTVNS